jgi:glutamate:Na+ symporter, ESS family
MLSLLILVALLLVGFALRAGVPGVRRLHVPVSVVAGVIGFACVQALSNASTNTAMSWSSAWLPDVMSWLRAMPTPLIALVFAGLLMEKPQGRAGRSIEVLSQGLAAWFVILGQVLIGVLLTWWWVGPAYGVPVTFGQLIEVGMAGGPGTARAFGDVFEKQFQFPDGVSLGLFVATFGLVWGLFSGIILARLGIRRGWTRQPISDTGPAFVSGIETHLTGQSLGTARSLPNVIDPLLLQLLWLGSAFGVGWLLQLAWRGGLGVFDDPANRQQLVDQLAGLPLFIFTTFGGLIVRESLHAMRMGRLLDGPTLQRLTGVALELVIVASITTVSLSALRNYFVPTLVLVALGSAWCVFNLVWVSRRLLPKNYWFELGLMNYGFATATTPQSMLLLKLADPQLKSGAAETYAAAVPLSAPFVGGGLVTFVGFPLLLTSLGQAWVALLLTAAMAALWMTARLIQMRRDVTAA